MDTAYFRDARGAMVKAVETPTHCPPYGPPLAEVIEHTHTQDGVVSTRLRDVAVGYLRAKVALLGYCRDDVLAISWKH